MERNIPFQVASNETVRQSIDDTLVQVEGAMSRRSVLAAMGIVGLGTFIGGMGSRSFGGSAVAKSRGGSGASMFGEGSNMFEGSGGFGLTRNDYVTAQIIGQEQPEDKVEDPKEAPKPKPEEQPTLGLDIFKSKELPKSMSNRMKSENVKGRVNSQKEVYKHAQNETGVPWQVMAAIHYREAGLNPQSSLFDGSSLQAGISQDGAKIYPDAKKDAVASAEHLKRNAKNYYGVDIGRPDNLSEEDIANAILSYNRGRMYLNNPGGAVPVSKSPYVYNYYNGKQMRWTRADAFDGDKRLNRIDGKLDGNPGALVVVAYLVQSD